MVYINVADPTCGGQTPCYTWIQEAINSATSGSILKIAEGRYGGDIILNKNKEISLHGGYDSDFNNISSDSTIDGKLTITSGTMTTNDIVLHTASLEPAKGNTDHNGEVVFLDTISNISVTVRVQNESGTPLENLSARFLSDGTNFSVLVYDPDANYIPGLSFGTLESESETRIVISGPLVLITLTLITLGDIVHMQLTSPGHFKIMSFFDGESLLSFCADKEGFNTNILSYIKALTLPIGFVGGGIIHTGLEILTWATKWVSAKKLASWLTEKYFEGYDDPDKKFLFTMHSTGVGHSFFMVNTGEECSITSTSTTTTTTSSSTTSTTSTTSSPSTTTTTTSTTTSSTTTTTLPPATSPTVTTGSATSVTSTSATLNGTVNPNKSSTTYYFQYGTSTSYGLNTSSTSAGSAASNVSASASVNGLSSNSTYHYRLVASNSAGTSYGGDGTFTTSGTGSVSAGVQATNSNWTDTGVYVENGKTFSVITTGLIRICCGSSPLDMGPDGVAPSNVSGFPAPSLPAYSLIGKIGQTGTPFFIGSSYTGNITTSGKLYLIVNDNDHSDNTGSFTANIGSNSTPANVAGTWEFYETTVGDPEDGPFIMVIAQSGSNLSLTISDHGDSVTGTGFVLGSKISLSFSQTNGDTISATGTVSGNKMSGTFSDSGGESGTWRAVPAGDNDWNPYVGYWTGSTTSGSGVSTTIQVSIWEDGIVDRRTTNNGCDGGVSGRKGEWNSNIYVYNDSYVDAPSTMTITFSSSYAATFNVQHTMDCYAMTGNITKVSSSPKKLF